MPAWLSERGEAQGRAMADAERFQILRPLGADATTFAARDLSSGGELVVVERVARGLPESERGALVRRARLLQPLAHPNVVRVRAVIDDDVEVMTVSQYIDGEWLQLVMALDPRPALEVILRLVLDVLEGLTALHTVGDERGVPNPIVHAALSPQTVVVAGDGVAQIARTSRIVRTGS